MECRGAVGIVAATQCAVGRVDGGHLVEHVGGGRGGFAQDDRVGQSSHRTDFGEHLARRCGVRTQFRTDFDGTAPTGGGALRGTAAATACGDGAPIGRHGGWQSLFVAVHFILCRACTVAGMVLVFAAAVVFDRSVSGNGMRTRRMLCSH